MAPAERSTIFAPASGHGRSPVAIMRISGPAARTVAESLLGRLPQPRQAVLATPKDAAGDPIDQALVLFFPGPHSFTGEDVLELQHHGGLAVARALADRLGGFSDLRSAEPGEFTKRAFLNGKLDLTEAEGLADLIEATTAAQARVALRQMSGSLGRLYGEWRECLLDALSLLEAEIDFAPDEEVPDELWLGMRAKLASVAKAMRAHLDDERRGERLQRGLMVAVTGAPNVGKSSLVNALAGRDAAIVTEIPGTTRDVIEVALDLAGMPVTLLDTAGIRESDDPIEQEGIARALSRAATADLRLRMVDDPLASRAEESDPLPHINVLNKVDLWAEATVPEDWLAVSAVNGQGLDCLVARIKEVATELLLGSDEVVITRSRHRAGIEDAEAALERAIQLGPGAELGLLAEELRLAARAIGRVTGAFGVEDILDRVFSTFCIGK